MYGGVVLSATALGATSRACVPLASEQLSVEQMRRDVGPRQACEGFSMIQHGEGLWTVVATHLLPCLEGLPTFLFGGLALGGSRGLPR